MPAGGFDGLDFFECSSGTCVHEPCTSDSSLCVVVGLAPGEKVTVQASSPDCYACSPAQQCPVARFDCPITPGTHCADDQPVRFDGFVDPPSGLPRLKGDWKQPWCEYTYTVPAADAAFGACWQCGPQDFDGMVYVGTDCDCQLKPVPPLPGASTTTTTLPDEDAVDAWLDTLIDLFIPIEPLARIIKRLILSADVAAPQKGTLRGQAVSGDTVVFKGKVRVRKSGPVHLALVVTPAGRRLLKHTTADTLPLTVTLGFRDDGTSKSRSRTITLSR